jgi:hypothetical protein
VIMNSRELLKQLLEQNQEIIAQVKQNYLHLSTELLSTKPEPKKWSLNEIFEHLNMANEPYLNSLRKELSAQKLPKYNAEFKSGFLGNLFTRLLEPKKGTVKNKMKAPSFLDPSKTGQNNMALEKYLTLMLELNEMILQAQKTDLEKIRIPFSLTPLIRFKMGDVFRFLTAHSQRHLIQAQKTYAQISKQSFKSS